MKKIKLLSAIAMAGFLGLSARAAIPVDYSSVNIKLTVLFQTNNTTSGSVTKFNVDKIKVTNKEVLNQVTNEFGTLPAGAQLVVNFGFYDGPFAVANKDGAIILANVSSSTNSYVLRINDLGPDIYTGKSVSGGTQVYDITTTGEFKWVNGNDTAELDIAGAASVKDTFPHTGNRPESFMFGGADNNDHSFFGENDVFVSGTLSGSGKNSSDF
jgi:hypothetical protein